MNLIDDQIWARTEDEKDYRLRGETQTTEFTRSPCVTFITWLNMLLNLGLSLAPADLRSMSGHVAFAAPVTTSVTSWNAAKLTAAQNSGSTGEAFVSVSRAQSNSTSTSTSERRR